MNLAGSPCAHARDTTKTNRSPDQENYIECILFLQYRNNEYPGPDRIALNFHLAFRI